MSYERGTPIVDGIQALIKFGRGPDWHWSNYLASVHRGYRGTSPIRNTPLLGPYSRTLPRVINWSYGGGLFLMSEVPLYSCVHRGQGLGCHHVIERMGMVCPRSDRSSLRG